MGYQVQRRDMTEPAGNAASVTPNDSTELSNYSRALYIGTSGNLKVTFVDGGTVTFSSHPVGLYPYAVKLVFSTGTTASNIIALW